jgi:polyvinyl alcohol dehydrogenase (cytochrome)
MRLSTLASLLAAIPAAIAMTLAAAAPADPVKAAPATTAELSARGAEVYRARCAACHENPVGRVPARTFLKQARNPEFVMRVLTSGAMRDIAASLSDDDKKAVATYLIGRPPRATAEIDPGANLCQARGPAMTLDGPAWNGWGGPGVTNARYQPTPGFSAAEVGRLKLKWAFALPGGSYNPPAVAGGRVFIGNMAGIIFALDAKSGCTYWSKDLGTPTRTAISIGKMPSGKYAAYVTDWWGKVYALDADTGAELWKVKVDDHTAIRLTGAPTLHQGRLYVPIASGEEGLANDPDYVCCTFRGTLVALDAATGKTIWRTHTIDQPAVAVPGDGHRMGPAGAGIWSAPTIDERRRLIYVATGDDYTDPATGASDAIIAFDLDTGNKRWTSQVVANDRYVGGCTGEARHRNCPQGEIGPDYDIGASPLLLKTTHGKEIVVALSKGAIAYGMDPGNGGRILWQTRLGRGGMLGGIEWGGATDGSMIFAPISDYPYPGMSTAPLDGWELSPSVNALSPDGGKLRWRVPAPQVACAWQGACNHAHAAAVIAMPGVVFAGAWDGHERAYSTRDGRILWDVDTARSFDAVNGAKAVGGTLDHGAHVLAGGTLFVTSGSRTGQLGNALLAYTIDGK